MKRLIPVLAVMLFAAWAPHGISVDKAYADSGSKYGDSKDGGSKYDDSKDKGSKDEGSKSSSSYSTTTPVCDCGGLVASADAAAAKADEEATKAREDADKAKSDDDKAKEDNDKTILCHVPPGNEGNPQTLYIASSAVSAHLSEHPGDYLGACSGDDSAQTKSYEEEKSMCNKHKEDADKAKSDADKCQEDADKAKSDADKTKSEMDAALAAGGAPCTCADGSTGTWIYGNPGSSATPTSLRQIRGQ